MLVPKRNQSPNLLTNSHYEPLKKIVSAYRKWYKEKMGEIIKYLTSVMLQNGIDIEIELNSSVTGKGEETVHIQTSNFRAEFFKSDFIESATAVLSAAYHINKIKNIEKNE